MERTYVQLNIINLITVTLMAAVGILIVGFIANTLKQKGGSDAA
jgi:hypothetical protein